MQSLSVQEILAMRAQHTVPVVPASNPIIDPRLPPHVVATYAGQYYKGVNSKELDHKPFEFTIRIPLPLVLDPTQTPCSIFVTHYTKRHLLKAHGESKTRLVNLIKCVGVPFESLRDNHMLKWITEYTDMAAVAKSCRVEYAPYDPLIIEPGYVPKPKELAEIRLELWPDIDSLRAAIMQFREDAEGFMILQKKRAEKGNVTYMAGVDQMIAALGD